LTENSTAGAVRLERSLFTDELDLATGDWTLTGWFKRDAATNIDVIAQLGNSGSYGPSALTLAFYGSGSTLEFRNYNSSNTADMSRTSVATGSWNHFAIVRSGSVISWYHNAALVGSDSSFALAITNSHPVKFGGSGATAVLDRWLNGSLADLAVFRAALTPSDITALNSTPVQWLGGQSSSATVSITVLAPIDTWRQTHFGSTANTGEFADTADKDKDGIPNLLEYALVTDPNARTDLGTRVVSDLAPIATDKHLRLTVTKNPTSTDVTYTIEVSSDLSTWTSAPTVIEQNTSTSLRVRDSQPIYSNPRRFIRLRVTRL
jgi:hypothetical protein